MLIEVQRLFQESIALKERVIQDNLLPVIENMGNQITDSIKNGKKIMLCGNGGSAADAQHLAAEMLIRLRPKNNRDGIPAISLAQDMSTMTACGNDMGYDLIYERMVRSLGQTGDCLIGISTSGNSQNIVRAMQVAREMDINVFGFLGCGGGEALQYCNDAFLVPSCDTGRVQEVHITAGHALMEYIEDALLDSGYLCLDNNAK